STIALLAASAISKITVLREQVAPLARRRRLVVGVLWLLLVVVVVNIVGCVIFFGLMRSGGGPGPEGQDPAVQPQAPGAPPGGGKTFFRTSKVSPTGEGYNTFAEVIAAVQPGDHVVVRAPVVTGAVRLEGPRYEGVVIEADPALGQPVVWQPAADHPKDHALLEVRNCPGFRVKGPFVLDGQDRVATLAKLVGWSPGVRFEDLHLKGVQALGLHLIDCNGETKKHVNLSRLRFTMASKPDAQGKGNGSGALLDGVQHVVLEDCRLEGGFAGAIQLAHEIKAVTV